MAKKLDDIMAALPANRRAQINDRAMALGDVKAKRVGALNVDAIKSQGRQRHKQATKE